MPAALLSLFLAALVGLGLWAFPERAWRGQGPPGGLAVVAAFGLALSHLPMYLSATAAGSVRATLAVGAAGLALAAWRARRAGGALPRWGARATGLLAISLYPAFRILTDPLTDWDARSIWFFHGKIAFLSPGGLLNGAWARPEIGFSHPDYPKLIPLLAAQGAALAGLWNDHWPKATLIVLLGLVQAGVHALPVRTATAWAASLALCGLTLNFLWNGYADGYLAAFAFLAGASLGSALLRPDPATSWLAVASLSLLAQVKNEGLVLAALLAAAFAAAAWLRGSPRALLRGLDLRAAILFLPLVLWAAVRAGYGVRNDVASGADVGRLLGRAADPTFWSVLGRQYFLRAPLNWALPAFGALVLAGRVRGRRWGNAAGAALAAAFALYSAFLILVYGLTPLDFQEHVRTSMFRVSNALAALLLSAAVVGWRPRAGDVAPGTPPRAGFA